MSGAVRVLLIWVLTIVIPFKAIAMGSAIGCGPGHHGSPSLEPAQFPVSDLADRGWAEQSGHASDGGHVGERMRGASGSTDVHDDERSPSAHAKVKCGTCAPCCAAVGPARTDCPRRFRKRLFKALLSPRSSMQGCRPTCRTDHPRRSPLLTRAALRAWLSSIGARVAPPIPRLSR